MKHEAKSSNEAYETKFFILLNEQELVVRFQAIFSWISVFKHSFSFDILFLRMNHSFPQKS